MRYYLLLLLSLTLPSLLWAQNEKVIHQTFDLNGITQLTIDLVGEVEVELWAGDNALAETKIQIWDAPPHVLKFFIEEKKRYEVLEVRNGEAMSLSANDPIRDPIRYKGNTCFETIRLRLLIPDSFQKVGEWEYRRSN
jgi:hypothetical protein